MMILIHRKHCTCRESKFLQLKDFGGDHSNALINNLNAIFILEIWDFREAVNKQQTSLCYK